MHARQGASERLKAMGELRKHLGQSCDHSCSPSSRWALQPKMLHLGGLGLMELLGALHAFWREQEQELHIGLKRDNISGEPCPSEITASQFKVIAITFSYVVENKAESLHMCLEKYHLPTGFSRVSHTSPIFTDHLEMELSAGLVLFEEFTHSLSLVISSLHLALQGLVSRRGSGNSLVATVSKKDYMGSKSHWIIEHSTSCRTLQDRL